MLWEAVYLLDQESTRLRQAMAGKIDNPDILRDWDLVDILNRRDFENEVSSTINRFRRFRDNTMLRCMFGLTECIARFGSGTRRWAQPRTTTLPYFSRTGGIEPAFFRD